MISGIKTSSLLLLLLFIILSAPTTAIAGATTLYQSVEQALKTNPQVKVLAYNRQALEYDLKRARGAYLPTVDLSAGYGPEQHSDDVTRKSGADPSDSDWDPRADGSLKLTQKVYDGGETGSQVSIQKAQLDSGDYQLQAAKQAVALDAVTAHLNVFRQRELVGLAEKNLKVIQDIYRSLAERERAGAGSIADVTQVQARLARAESTLYLSQAELSQAIANYTGVIGTPPGELAYAGVPETLPQTLEEALQRTENRNPELLALNAEVVEADSRLALARSKFKPKFDIELSSRYNDQVEGNDYWENTNAALLVMRWNLFNGGRDRAGMNAALSRKQQSRSKLAAKLNELTESTSAVWANYLALQRQKVAFRDAVDYSRKTFDAYLIQFSVSKRSMLDVLIVENEYFQSAVQLVTVDTDETTAAYRILSLSGDLQVPRYSGAREYPEDYRDLAQTLVFPSATQLLSPPTQSLSSVQESGPVQEAIPVQGPNISGNSSESKKNAASYVIESTQHYGIEIGPCINRHELNQATEALGNYGFDVQQISGTGVVRFTRLLEGVYPPDEARRRLAVLKKAVDSAFLLPESGQIGLFAGSFHESERAARFAELLGQKQIKVTLVESEIEMQGTILVVQKVDRKTAETIAEQMSGLGLTAKVIASVSNLKR